MNAGTAKVTVNVMTDRSYFMGDKFFMWSATLGHLTISSERDYKTREGAYAAANRTMKKVFPGCRVIWVHG